MALSLFKMSSSFIVGFSAGYMAVALIERFNISPLIAIIPAAAITLAYSKFLSKVK